MKHMNLWADALSLSLDLQLFAEGGDGSGGTGGAPAGADSSTPPQSSKETITTGTGTDAGTDTGTDTKAAGKTYTDEDAKAVSKQFGLMTHMQAKTRYKGAIERGAKYDSLAVKMQAVADQYGMKAEDSPEAILDAMLTDRVRVRERAAKLGIDEDSAESIIRTENENAIYKALADFKRMSQEEEAVKAVYADFYFRAEAENPAFKVLVDSGIPMKQAYEMTHYAEISAKAIALAREEARAEALAEFRANGARPSEGISGNTSAGVVKTDYSRMSQKDLQNKEKEIMNSLRRKA